MDVMKTDYEFLDLSDVKGTDLSDLKSALSRTEKSDITANNNWTPPTIDPYSVGASAEGSTVSIAESLGGDCDMAGSPARGAPPPPYAAPPPPYAPPPQWPVAPPNVYVSQVTANVNVHGYMGQYYQPGPAYVPQTTERAPRPHKRERRGKRPPSPPPPPHHHPPYYVQYPPYYGPAQAQGAPLYHLPMYQPIMYPPYAYPPYYHEYPVPVEGEGDKGPEEYPPEVVMEQEAVEAYYAGAHYAPPYPPPPEGVEYMPQVYLPPPPPMNQPPPHHHTQPHQFNVHAKNFVHNPNKNYGPLDKPPEQKTPPATASAVVEALPMKDLKISKGPTSPKQNPITVSAEPPKPASPTDKTAGPKPEGPKPAWTSTDIKTDAVSGPAQKPFPPTVSANQSVIPSKGPQPVKVPKGPTAPFSGAKQSPKPPIPQTSVPVPQTVSTPKAPFGNRQKKEGTMNRSPSSENTENVEKPPIEHVKREPPLPPSKAPISININIQGPPLTVTNKPPFSHSRKIVPEPVVVPQPPPPAPTASDFPPPPTPRNRQEPAPSPVQTITPTPSGKSWASLFNKSTTTTTSVVTAAPMVEEPSSPTSTVPVKPVAKVPPFDASPLQQGEKTSPTVARVVNVLSYSEKTSVNAVSVNKTVSPSQPSQAPTATSSEPTAVAAVTMPTSAPPLPVQPSPFADDPNSYRMGEFLLKYQLDHRPVSLMPRGLTNRSNYCYVNAVLQALIACPPFYNMLKALPYQTRRGKSSTPVIDAMVELCYEFTSLPPNARVSRARGSEGSAGSLPIQTGPPLDPSAGQKVLRALRPFPGSQEGRQEDAEEFLSCLLNGLNDEMLELMKLVEPEENKEAQVNGVAHEQPPEEDDDDDEWKVMGPRNRGAVERVWGGAGGGGCGAGGAAGAGGAGAGGVGARGALAALCGGRTRLRTHSAAATTDHVHPFFTLQLDCERASSVKDALDLLAGKDTLEGVSDAWQQLSIEELPVVLLLHMKCFQIDSEGHTAKIVKNVDFPIDLKIDQKIMSAKQKYTGKSRHYKLFAVVYHDGVEATKGHYLTDTYHPQAGWIRYDDSTVTLVSDAQVLKPKPPRMPYLLMYRRQDMLPVHRTNKTD